MLKPADRTRSLLGNTVVLTLAQVSGIVVSLLLTPFVLNTLGIERYGLWAFVNSIVAFATLLQFGVGRGSVRFISFYGERRELDVVRRIVSYGVIAHLVAGIVLTPIIWLAGRAIFPHLDISADLVPTAENLFPLVFAYFFFAGAIFPFGALLIGLERMWITSIVTLASQLLYAAAVVILLSTGAGLYGLVAAVWLQSAAQGAVYILISKRLIGRVVGNPFALDRRLLREMVKFGGWLQVTRLMGFVNRQTDAIVIGSWLNLAAVGFFDIGNRIAQQVRTLPLTLLGPLLPAAAGIHAQGDEKRLARTILQASRLIGLLSIGMAGFVLATAPLIMSVWLGRAYPNVVWIAALMVLAQAASCLAGVGTTVVSAIGKPRYESEYALLSVALNIGGTLALAPFFGLYGIVGGTVFGITVSTVYFLRRFYRVMRLPMWAYLGAWLWRLVAATVASALAVYVLRSFLTESTDDGRGIGGLILIGLAFLYLPTLLVSLRAFSFFEARDLAVLQRVLPNRLRPLARLAAVEFLFGARL
jgi:O-antigen/teichoic acid export membrane protein